MPDRQRISSGSPWEDIVGYSRAVRVGDMVYVAGTVASDAEGNVIGGDDLYEQAKAAILKIEKALKEAGATLADVVRTRMFVTDISRWEEAGRAHSEFFKAARPASTMVEVSRLVGDAYLIEVEVEAVVGSGS